MTPYPILTCECGEVFEGFAPQALARKHCETDLHEMKED